MAQSKANAQRADRGPAAREAQVSAARRTSSSGRWSTRRRSTPRRPAIRCGSGRAGARELALVQAVEEGARVEAALREVVHRRQAQRLLQLPRPPRHHGPPHQGRADLGGGARRHPHPDLLGPLPRGAALRGRAQAPRRPQGRPDHDLHADGPRGRHRHAGLHPHRRRPHASSSAASRRSPCATGSTTPSPSSSSPPTAAGGAGRSCRSRRTPTRRSRSAPTSAPSSSSSAPASRSTCRPAATSGGTTSSRASSRSARPSRWTPRTCSTCSTPPGSTGKPKGIIHTTGGYLTGVAATHKWVFDIHEDDVYWCTADVGWVTGHSYVVYGPLANGATTVMYEGTPDFPDKDRFWRIVEKHGITICYTAPTAIRTFMRWGEQYPEAVRPLEPAAARLASASRSTPRRGSGTGRSSAAAAARSSTRGGRPRPATFSSRRCPGITVLKPGSATRPFPGIDAEVLDEQGKPAAVRLPGPAQAVAGHAARDLGRPRPVREAVLVKVRRTSTLPATAPSATRTATSGCWAAWTTS